VHLALSLIFIFRISSIFRNLEKAQSEAVSRQFIASYRLHLVAVQPYRVHARKIRPNTVSPGRAKGVDDRRVGFRYVLPVLSAFVNDTLPSLPIFSNENVNSTSLLTSCDLSAQNILVTRPDRPPYGRDNVSSGQPKAPLRLSGIVDWEYAGFFSPVEEFLTASPETFDLVPHPEDGVGDAYARCVLPALRARGVDTPHDGGSVFTRSWPEAQLLHRLRDHLVPWWMRGLDDSERAREIKDASRIVSSIIDQLRGT